MATFNATSKGRMKTTNKSGHAAYKIADKRLKLTTMALTTMLAEPKFYGDNTDELIEIAQSLCKHGDGEFVAKLAVWARTKGNLRSVSHALIAVVGHCCSGEPFVRPAVRRIASMRGDDGTEILAAHKGLYGEKVRWPHAIQRGVRDALEGASPYTIAKYQSRNKDLKMRDTLRITHPNALNEATVEAMGKCVDGTLPFPKSWETELSERGNTKEVWDELIAEHKVPYMAALRNLRNMIQAGADIDPVLDMLSDREAVMKSRQLPFRYVSAYKELLSAGIASTKVSRAIDMALAHSCRNVEPLPGRTAVLVDTSGSMGGYVSQRSKASCRDIAAVLAAILVRVSDDACVISFDTGARLIPMTGMSVLSDMGMVGASGGATIMESGFHYLMDYTGFDADRVIVLSDMEVNGWRLGSKPVQQCMAEYRRKMGHQIWCHAIDLQGYGTAQFIGETTNIMAGWSEQMLRFVSLAEKGVGTLVDDIDGMVL